MVKKGEWHYMLDIELTAKQNFENIKEKYPVSYQAVKKALQRLKKNQNDSGIDVECDERLQRLLDLYGNSYFYKEEPLQATKPEPILKTSKSLDSEMTYNEYCQHYYGQKHIPNITYDTILIL